MFRKQDTKIHFVGIGGMGMCGIAEVLINLGYKVTGSDMRETEITRHLASLGGTIHRAHRAENVGDADVVVVSSAIRGYNPELEAARPRGRVGARATRPPVRPRPLRLDADRQGRGLSLHLGEPTGPRRPRRRVHGGADRPAVHARRPRRVHHTALIFCRWWVVQSSS